MVEDGFVIHLNRVEAPLRLAEVFAGAGSFEVEIGFGKGLFLVAEAGRRSSCGFLGIESSTRYLRWTRRILERDGPPNVRLVREEAAYFVERYIPPKSITRFHIYYPDPWTKRRHRKRRLIRPQFVRCLGERLAPGGEIRVATDHEEYFGEIRKVIELEPLLEVVPDDPREWEGWWTNFARKYERDGRPVFRARYRKVSPI